MGIVDDNGVAPLEGVFERLLDVAKRALGLLCRELRSGQRALIEVDGEMLAVDLVPVVLAVVDFILSEILLAICGRAQQDRCGDGGQYPADVSLPHVRLLFCIPRHGEPRGMPDKEV